MTFKAFFVNIMLNISLIMIKDMISSKISVNNNEHISSLMFRKHYTLV